MKASAWAMLAAGACVALMLRTPLLAQQQDNSDDGGNTGTDTTLVPVPARMLPRAESGLMLDVARTGSGLVAVGGHGDILVSADGRKWQQVAVPADTTLTNGTGTFLGTLRTVGSRTITAKELNNNTVNGNACCFSCCGALTGTRTTIK